MCYLVEDIVDLLTADKADMTFPQQASHFTSHLILADTHHDHESRHVVQHDDQDAVLVVLQALLLRLPQGGIPGIYNTIMKP